MRRNNRGKKGLATWTGATCGMWRVDSGSRIVKLNFLGLTQTCMCMHTHTLKQTGAQKNASVDRAVFFTRLGSGLPSALPVTDLLLTLCRALPSLASVPCGTLGTDIQTLLKLWIL